MTQWQRFKGFLKRLNYVLSPAEKPKTVPPRVSGEVDENKPTLHTCYHECGHYLVAWLFPESVRINKLCANKLNLTNNMNGGLAITQLAGQETLTSSDKMMLVSAGGISAATIFTYGMNYTQRNLSVFPKNSSLMDRIGADDDYAMMQQFSELTGYDARFRKHPSYVMWSGIQFVLLYLMESVVWNSVELLANHLQQCEQYEMTTQEVQTLLSKNIDLKALESVKQRYIAKRYPLTKATIATIV